LDQHEETSFSSEEKDKTCFAVYYPLIGVFNSKKKMNRAYERTKRPGEEIAVESQGFDTPETAVDAIKGKYPDFVITGMNEFQMARIKEAPRRWPLLEGLAAVWTVLMLALLW